MNVNLTGISYGVTPLVGVWIEISVYLLKYINVKVTPLVGVWIEIVRAGTIPGDRGSLPLWECGLK